MPTAHRQDDPRQTENQVQQHATHRGAGADGEGDHQPAATTRLGGGDERAVCGPGEVAKGGTAYDVGRGQPDQEIQRRRDQYRDHHRQRDRSGGIANFFAEGGDSAVAGERDKDEGGGVEEIDRAWRRS